MTTTLPPQIAELITRYGDLGVLAGMFLESSVIPLPSELVITAAAAVGIPVMSILIFGSIGAALGGMVGYAIGRFAGLPVILKFGKYIFITHERLQKAQAFACKYGAWGVFLGRLLPVIPFKVFSIAAGISRIPFSLFVLGTMLGLIPRMIILSYFGVFLVKYTKLCLIICGAIALVALLVWAFRKYILKK